jgi:hypothetical protein
MFHMPVKSHLMSRMMLLLILLYRRDLMGMIRAAVG